MLKQMILAGMALVFTGCMHLKGVVTDDVSGRPLRTAILTVGRPDGIAVYIKQPVDQNGAFDFNISTLDLSNVYVYDSAAAPELTMVHIDTPQLGEKMKLRLHAPPRQQDSPLMMPLHGLD